METFTLKIESNNYVSDDYRPGDTTPTLKGGVSVSTTSFRPDVRPGDLPDDIKSIVRTIERNISSSQNSSVQAFQQFLLNYFKGKVNDKLPKKKAAPAKGSKEYWQDIALKQAQINSKKWKPTAGFVENTVTVRKVYDFYGFIYRKHPEIQWAGMAKLAGAPIYGGLQDIEKLKLSLKVNRELIPAALPTVPVRPLTDPVIESQLKELEFLEKRILEMQKKVYDDLSWQFVAYDKGGIKAIREIRKHNPKDMSAANLRAWENIASGNKERILKGNMWFLEREQREILRSGFDDIDKRRLSEAGLSLFTNSPIPGGKSFKETVPTGRITRFGDRWAWIQTEVVQKWQGLSDEDKKRLVFQDLQQLADRNFVTDKAR